MVIVYIRYDASEIIFQRDDINTLKGADLRGADLGRADLAGADLRGADLGGANLCYADLRDADLRAADLGGANLCYASLWHADLRNADLRGADLTGAFLKDADLRDARLPDGVPILDRPYTRVLEQIRGDGSLNMNNWHTCKTTHCLAGWLIHLCGDEGYALEIKLTPSTAGALIHARNCPDEKVPNFRMSNTRAIKYINDRADQENTISHLYIDGQPL